MPLKVAYCALNICSACAIVFANKCVLGPRDGWRAEEAQRTHHAVTLAAAHHHRPDIHMWGGEAPCGLPTAGYNPHPCKSFPLRRARTPPAGS